MRKLTTFKIASTLGVEEETVKSILSREDEELSPYVTQKQDKEENGYTLDLEGLPLLIKKLSFNLPTADIIENLACQVLHLTALEQNNFSLKEEVKKLSIEVDQLRHEVTELRKQMEEERNRSLTYKISKIFRPNE